LRATAAAGDCEPSRGMSVTLPELG
jgi:hypothetical protein